MTKPELRRLARARLAALTPAERARASAAIARRVWQVEELAGARALLVYAALPEEVATDGIAREAQRRGIAVLYPRCLPGSRTLALHRLDREDGLRRGHVGLLEPDAELCPAVPVAEVDAALVPGLAWDRAGRRLGRGAGYYDRLFADPAWRGFRCGLYFAAQELPALPADPWDAPLHAVVTEREVVRRTR